jgi:DNA-binding transcriptional LysR family regulator
MDTRFLESFLVVVEGGSIAEAARRLNLTPAAVAQRIAALEAEIGASLLMRSGRTVRPTSAAINIIDRARNLVREVENLKVAAGANLLTGELRVGSMSTALVSILPDILSSLAAHHPQIDVSIVRGVSADLYRDLLQDNLDIALIVQPQFALPKSCAWLLLEEEPLVAVVPARLAQTDPHTAMAREPYIRYDPSHAGGRMADEYLRKAGIRPRVRFELDALDAIAVLVDRGLGVSLLPDRTPPWPEGLAISRLPLPIPFPPRRIGVMWKRSSMRISVVQAFLDQIGIR